MDLEQRIKELEEENAKLRLIIEKGSRGNSSAYNTIKNEISYKVENTEFDTTGMEDWIIEHRKSKLKRNMMDDLKWDLRVRNIADFRAEHIEPALEYIKSYRMPEILK